MRKLILDSGLPLRAAGILRTRGIDAIHTEEVGLASAPDPVIVRWAEDNGYSCVTLDHDFHMLLAESNASGPSVILLRFQSLRAQSAATLILTVLERVGTDLELGIAVTATPRGIRIRKLPFR